MIDKIRNRMESDEGFTLIELLVVILIIGILAAIAIPSFLNQRYKGQDACAKAMTKQMQTAAKTYQTDNNSYTGMGLASLSAIESSITGTSTATGNCVPQAGTAGVGLNANASTGSCTGSPGVGFCVSSQSVNGNTFAIAEDGAGGVTRTCSVPTGGNAGGCKGASAGGNGTW